jgi:hypothetical protein
MWQSALRDVELTLEFQLHTSDLNITNRPSNITVNDVEGAGRSLFADDCPGNDWENLWKS